MKKLILLVIAIIAVGPAFAATDQSKALDTTKAFVEAMRTHDYGTMVDLVPAPFVKAQGGKEKMVAALEAAKDTADVQVLSAEFASDPQKIDATDAIIYFVRADLHSLYKKQKRIVAHTFYVTFRFKDQSSWSVLDGSTFNVEQLRKVFRGLPDPLAIPKAFAELEKEEAIQPAQTTPGS